jgi:hypothetical protein
MSVRNAITKLELEVKLTRVGNTFRVCGGSIEQVTDQLDFLDHNKMTG